MDDHTALVRQISQFPFVPFAGINDAVLLQEGGMPGGRYVWTTANGITFTAAGVQRPSDMRGTGALAAYYVTPNGLTQAVNWYVANTGEQNYLQAGVAGRWDNTSGSLRWSLAPVGLAGTPVDFWQEMFAIGWDGNVKVLQQLTVGRSPVLDNEVATLAWVKANTLASFNGRSGAITLSSADVNAAFALAPGDTLVSLTQVDAAICQGIENWYTVAPLVFTWNGRLGDVCLLTEDVNAAYANGNARGVYPTAPNPSLGDASSRIATCAFVDESLSDLYDTIQNDLGSIIDLTGYAPLNSPDFTGVPTAPTANPGTTTGQIATTAFVQAAVTASTTGVSSFNTRTGAVVLSAGDITAAGGAPLASPSLSGTPTAPTASPGTATTQLATTAFVAAALAALGSGVSSFNTRVGAVTLTTGDITGAGGAAIASPTFTGVPAVPTAAPGTNTTQAASTAFVQAALATAGAGVTSFNSRTGAVTLQNNDVSAAGGALIASPTFTGVPAGPTATPGTATTQLATTAFVAAAIAAGVAGVTSFNTRTGAVTLVTADITSAGGAPIASPVFTGTPAAPTAVTTDNSTTLATTAFVKNAIAATALVASFNTRTGAVTLSGADVSAAGGALLASPTFTGTPAAPTATPGTSTTQLATTAFVAAALGNVVTSFNGRNGAVTLTGADITGAGGALTASPALTGTPTAPTATAGTNNTTLATTAFVMAAVGTAAGATYALNRYTANGTFTTPVGSTTSTVYKVRQVGGGGGGSSQSATGGGGGGAGQYKEFAISGIPPSTACAITIGAAGTAGTLGSIGTAGGNTTFAVASLGTTITCNGATVANSNGNPGIGGTGGATTAGTATVSLVLDMTGQDGDYGGTYSSTGGSSLLGTAGRQWNGSGTGSKPSSGFGAGGPGGFAVVGQNGTPGIVIIERIQG